MMNKLLTVIITFLNEKEEVKNTIDSLIEHLNNDIDIILINDSSDDNYDYLSDIKQYNLIYIENDSRIGVARSRDKGVGICQTPYFLFLDAHMRFFDNKWFDLVISELNKDDRCILCCQTKFLRKEIDVVIEDIHERISYGAYLNLEDPIHFFELQWQFAQTAEQKKQNIIDIPCIIGAGYAASKRYWSYLHGLWGLERYGLDEAYISIKVWLEGGRCKLIKNFVIGHIYRLKAPYIIEDVSQIYNKLLLLILLTPRWTRDKCLAEIKQNYPDLYYKSLLLLDRNIEYIVENKLYYKKIFKNKFKLFYQINCALSNEKILIDDNQKELYIIAGHIKNKISFLKNVGLFNGKAGILLFLFHYARYSQNRKYWDLSKKNLNEVIVVENNSLSFDTGSLGLGWSIEYLYQNGFIQEDDYVKFDIIEKISLNCDLSNWTDLGLNQGFGGIVRYILAKLYTLDSKSMKSIKLNPLIKKLYEASFLIIKQRMFTDCIDTYLAFIWYIDNQNPLGCENSIYHVLNIFTPKKYNFKHLYLGLDGLSGIGLNIILNSKPNYL